MFTSANMPARKRAREEVEAADVPPVQPKDPLLAKLRNTWEFANLMQYIFLFGKAVRIDEDFGIEVGNTNSRMTVDIASRQYSALSFALILNVRIGS